MKNLAPKPKLPVKLPIDALIPELKQKLSQAQSIVVQASPGSGKTTRIPPALLGDQGEVLVLEPRRVAAKYAAKRVAEELGTRLGELVGYQFRFENVSSARTRLRFLTEGMLMRRLLSDSCLRSAHTVILDEFHERHLHGDIALAYLRRLQLNERPDLKIVVMSATLDSELISKYLGDASILKIDAPIHPIEIEYLPSASSKYLDSLVRDAVIHALEKDEGDILVFLPGMTEIRRSLAALREVADRHNAIIAPLHGELSREEQDFAIERGQKRKIILATNVAETSLTIEGVTTVVDSGYHRIANYSWWSGVPTLRTRPISRASAIQRAGRAGRTGPGRCIRLYTKGDFESRAPFQPAEVQRADLTQTVLELKSLGVTRPSELGWFEAPPAQALESAENLLYRLGALENPFGELSETGKSLSHIPAHPRIGRMLLSASSDAATLKEAAMLGAMISEGELEMTDALESLRKGFSSERVRKLSEQLRGSVETGKTRYPSESLAASLDRPLAFSVLTGFPDRVARRKQNGDLVFSESGSAKSPDAPIFHSSEYFVLLDVQERQGLGQARSTVDVKSAVAIESDWLLDLVPSQIEEREELIWDKERKRVQATSQLRYGQLILSESRSEPSDRRLASKILAKEGLGLELELWGTKLSLQDCSTSLGVESWVARVGLLRRLHPEFPIVDVPLLRDFVEKSISPHSALQDVQELQWETELTGCLEETNPGAAQELRQWTPLEFSLPNGRRVPIHYQISSAPWIESRLQDFFGVKTPPSILKGQLALTLHLLAPNQRAVQVTADLPGFWQRIYPEVRKELSRRYPRHSWPEDPSQAEASDSRIKPRRK